MTSKRPVRETLHRIVDELPDNELRAAKRYMEYLRNMSDPLVRKLAEAPYDDEPETEEERAAVEEAYEDFEAGRVYTSEEVKRELGL